MMKRLWKQKAACHSCIALLLFIAGVNPAWACRMPPPEQLMGVDEQIQGARDVSLAKVVRAMPTADGLIEYEFVVLKRLAGFDRKSFTVTVLANDRPHSDNDFNSHTDEAFWQRGGGRLFNDTDCVIYPTFVVGDRAFSRTKCNTFVL